MKRMCYNPKRITTKEGKKTGFLMYPSGSVYADHDGQVRKVGVATPKGIKVNKKYLAKFEHRLQELDEV